MTGWLAAAAMHAEPPAAACAWANHTRSPCLYTGAVQHAILGDPLEVKLEQALLPAIVPLVAFLYEDPAAAQLLDSAFGNKSALVSGLCCMLSMCNA